MTRRRLTKFALAVVAVACSLPLASVATAPLGSTVATPPGVPTLGFVAMLRDGVHTVSAHFLADGSRLTISAFDTAGAAWHITLEPGALTYPLDIQVTPLVRAAVWGSGLRPVSGVLIEPAAELAVPAAVSADGPGGVPVTPTLVADTDGRNLRLAPHAPGRTTAELSRLGAVFTGDVPLGVATTERAAVLDASARLLPLPIAASAAPPELAAGCAGAADVAVRRTLTDAVVGADIDPERALVEQLAAGADATGTSRVTDAPIAKALADRVVQRLTAGVEADRASPGGGARRFDAPAAAAESITSVLGLFPSAASTPATPPPAPATPRTSPTPGIERTVVDPMTALTSALAAWAADLTVADARALATEHDYDAPARVAARERVLAPLGVRIPGDATGLLLAAEHYHLTIDVSVVSHPGVTPSTGGRARLEADLAPGQGGPGSASGSSGGVAIRLGGLLPCSSPPKALLGADSFGAGQPAATALDASVRSAFANQLAATGGFIQFPLIDGASPAVDATITGKAGARLDVAVHAVLLHAPGQ